GQTYMGQFFTHALRPRQEARIVPTPRGLQRAPAAVKPTGWFVLIAVTRNLHQNQRMIAVLGLVDQSPLLRAGLPLVP
ncbi:hypothetical protein FQN49_008028, partial [Arthroderma sp. PD_2]